jgi:HPt (histidine-containing phosphotransfer) domain-containing protein
MDLSLLYSQLIGINGLDLWEGLSYVGCNRKVYADTLKLFCEDFEKKLPLAVSSLESNNWKEYTFALHSVRGALAGIGAWELAQKAQELEHASRNGDYELCHRDTGAALSEMESFARALRATVLFDETEWEAPTSASPDFLEEKLAALAGACASGHAADAETLAKELRGKTFDTDTETGEFVETLCAYVDTLDYDIVLKLLDDHSNKGQVL